jgi:hypothetical protein
MPHAGIVVADDRIRAARVEIRQAGTLLAEVRRLVGEPDGLPAAAALASNVRSALSELAPVKVSTMKTATSRASRSVSLSLRLKAMRCHFYP